MLAYLPALILLILQAAAGGDAQLGSLPETRVAWARLILEASERTPDTVVVAHTHGKPSVSQTRKVVSEPCTTISIEPAASWAEGESPDAQRPRDGPAIA